MRLHDNPALYQACQDAPIVLPVYIVDPASNWGNWNRVAQVGANAHGDRSFNIYTQATRYDSQGAYVKRWCPELQHVPADKL